MATEIRRGIDAIAEEWLTELRALKYEGCSTPDNYSSYIRDFLGWLAAQDPHRAYDHLDRPSCIRFIADRRRGNRSSSVRVKVAVLKTWWEWMRERGYVLDNPWRGLRIRVEVDLPEVLSPEEISKIVDACVDRPRDLALVQFLYASGGRRAEVSGMDVDDVELAAGDIVLRRTKGARERAGLIHARAVDALRLWLVERERILKRWLRQDPALFVTRSGRRLSPDMVWSSVRAIGKRAGLTRKLKPHVFRHTYATDLLERGADLRVVQELLGHTRITSTQRYTHVRPAHMREAYLKAHPLAGLDTVLSRGSIVQHDPSKG